MKPTLEEKYCVLYLDKKIIKNTKSIYVNFLSQYGEVTVHYLTIV